MVNEILSFILIILFYFSYTKNKNKNCTIQSWASWWTKCNHLGDAKNFNQIKEKSKSGKLVNNHTQQSLIYYYHCLIQIWTFKHFSCISLIRSRLHLLPRLSWEGACNNYSFKDPPPPPELWWVKSP